MSAVLTVAGELADKYSVLKLLSESTVNLIASAVVLGAGVVLIAAAIIKGVGKKEINTADTYAVVFLFTAIMAFLVTALTPNAPHALIKYIASGAILAIAILLLALRVIISDGSVICLDETPKPNATIKAYYKAFFKKYWIFAILYSIFAVVALVLIEKADISTVMKGESAVVFWAIIGVSLLSFATLYFARIKDRDIDSVDVVLFVMGIGGLALIPLAFMVGAENRAAVLIFSLALIILSVVLSALLIENTHIETEKELDEYSHLKGSVKIYFKHLFRHASLLSVVTASLFIAGAIAIFSATHVLSDILWSLSLKEPKHLVIAGFVAVIVLFAILVTDVRLHRIETVDEVLFATVLSAVLLLIVEHAIMGMPFFDSGLMLILAIVLGVILIALRIHFVKEVEVDLVIMEETVPTVEESVSTVEEAVPVTEMAVTEAPVIEVVEAKQEIVEAPLKLRKVPVKKSYETYLRTGDEQLKENYSAIRNEFESFGMHSRMTKARENFSKKGLSMSKAEPEKALRIQAKLLIRGKFLKLYLNVDPNTLDEKYFRMKDVSAKSPDQPTYLKIRSKLSLKRAIELINILAEKEGFKKKKKYEPINFKEEYTDSGLSYMEKLGYDYMVKESVTLDEVLNYKPDWAERVIKSKIIPDAERYIYDEVTLSEIAKKFKSGAKVDLEALRASGLIKINANHVTVKPSEKLNKKFYIEANEIDEKAVQMIAIAGGEVTRLVFE